MQPFMKTQAESVNNTDVATVRRTMEGLLIGLFGHAPRQITTIFAQNMILVRAFHPFPEAEAKMVSSRTHDSLCQQYYDRLFRVSDAMMKAELSTVLGCGIQQIQHVLNPNAQELDIIIFLNLSSANNSNYTEE
jgi:uncharacterized protein YbcI